MEKENRRSVVGIASVVGMSLMFILVASVLLFIPAVQVIYICYAVCAAMIIIGIYMIVRYFLTDAFRNLNEFGFSFGVLFVILGLCGMLKSASLASSFLVIAGIALLFSGVIMLQFALDLKRMKDVLWVVMLVISVAVTLCSILVILQPFGDRVFYEEYTSYVLFVAGCLCLVVMIYVYVRIRLYEKAEAAKTKVEESSAETPCVDETATQKEEKTSEEIKESVATSEVARKISEDSQIE